MVTQKGQLLFYRGAVCTITTINGHFVTVRKWKTGAELRIRIKDITLHPKGGAWKASEAKAI